jgi:hypothetical protein
MRARVAVLLAASFLSAASARPQDFNLTLDAGGDVSLLVQSKVTAWLGQIGGGSLPVLVAAGSSAAAKALISDEELGALGSEGYMLRGKCDASGKVTIAVRGNAREGSRVGAFIGNHFGLYALLEVLGVHFMHPLQPTHTPSMSLNASQLCSLDVTAVPHWPVRIWHYHTMHPIDMAELFNGFDSVRSAQPWASMLPEASRFFEWLLANKQNGVEWVALFSKLWPAGFADGALRKSRLRNLTDLAHDYGLEAGVDIPIALEQQHSWYMVALHCTHTLYSYTVLIHCTHTLYSYTVLIHCTHRYMVDATKKKDPLAKQLQVLQKRACCLLLAACCWLLLLAAGCWLMFAAVCCCLLLLAAACTLRGTLH